MASVSASSTSSLSGSSTPSNTPTKGQNSGGLNGGDQDGNQNGSGTGQTGNNNSGDNSGNSSPVPFPSGQFDCQGCSLIPQQIIVPVGSTGDESATLVDQNGNVQGTILIPSSVLQGAGTVTVASASLESGVDTSKVGSIALNVTLLDSSGNEITQLDSNVELCLQVQDNSKDVSHFSSAFYSKIDRISG